MNINDFVVYLRAILNALEGFFKRLALLIEWRRWNRAARRNDTSYRCDRARQKAAELEEIIFKKWEE